MTLGEALPEVMPELLRFGETRALLRACQRHPDFDVIELRKLDVGSWESEGVVVQCDNRQVPPRNKVGIRPVETLLLTFSPVERYPYGVRALREDFPILLHQNAVREGEPVSLCLYEQPWDHVRRSWTPERFLERILQWLGRSAEGTLHDVDQPLEGLFYENNLELVLPSNFATAWLDTKRPMHFAQIEAGNVKTLRPIDPDKEESDSKVIGLSISVGPIGHLPLSRLPGTLGQLADQFRAMGSDLVAPLQAALSDYCPESGLSLDPELSVLVFVRIPRIALDGSEVRSDIWAAMLAVDPARLGVDLGVLDRGPVGKEVFRSYSGVLGAAPNGSSAWRNVALDLIKPRYCFGREAASALSGFSPASGDFDGVIAGMGAIGGSLLDLWWRSGWGRWVVIDDDRFLPHNVVRHRLSDPYIGHHKSAAMAHYAHGIYPDEPPVRWVAARVEEVSNEKVVPALRGATLVVDATTTTSAPRDLSRTDGIGRCASAFMTPSGESSVLIMEDRARATRLVALEAQYLRAVINESWGITHLSRGDGRRTGAGCRDVSMVMSFETVSLHAATLAKQIRERSESDSASIGIWVENSRGGIDAYDVPVAPAQADAYGAWSLGWDDGIEDKLRNFRITSLPNETGGILVGIIDTAARHVQVVDALPPPEGSHGSTTEFVRAAPAGVIDTINYVREMTGQSAEYIGEWHTHPRGSAAAPSRIDIAQWAGLSVELEREGVPATFAIVGDPGNVVSWSMVYMAKEGRV